MSVLMLDVGVHRLDLAPLDRQQPGRGARVLDRLPGLLEFYLLQAICGEDRDRLALQFACHLVRPSFGSCPARPAAPASWGETSAEQGRARDYPCERG
jgi:hypothetical protein